MEDLIDKLKEFAEERDWEQYHSPKNLAMALCVEVAELVEHFQWLTQAQSYVLDAEKRAGVRDEIGDVLIYLVKLADKLGIDPVEAAHKKIEKNRRNYPVSKAKGNALKYNEYGERKSEAVVKDPVCGVEFVQVRGGEYEMGDTLGEGLENELPVHTVALDDFYISRWPITQAQWSVLMDENPSAFQHPDHPVEQVTWAQACDFARALSQAKHGHHRFMLPTEAQWEYAARSRGAEDLYAGGDDLDAFGWYEANSQGTPHPVGRKKLTTLGLYDMSGNVWEWCRDTFEPDAYARHGRHNPVMESNGPDRVIRGGSWNLGAWDARCARRFTFRADFYGPGLGFRLVMLTP